jgi:chaperonin GroEL (HSP60 family)
MKYLMTKEKQSRFGSNNTGIYNEAVTQVENKELRDLNLQEVKSIARIITPIFGPKGLTKLINQDSTQFLITQKGYQVATTLKSELPIVKMLRKLVDSQQENCGDGTKTVLLITGVLLEKAKMLLELGIGPQVISRGYYLGMKKALEILEENVIPLQDIHLQDNNDTKLANLIGTIITNKFGIAVKQHFINLILKLVRSQTSIAQNSSKIEDLSKFDFSNIFFRNASGRGMMESELINGFIVYKNRTNIFTPARLSKSRIILIQGSIDYFIDENHKMFYTSEIEDPSKAKQIYNFQQDYYGKLAESLKNKGINVVLCQKRVNEALIEACSQLGMIILDMVGEKETQTLSKMLNIPAITSIKSISEKEIQTVDLTEFRTLGKDEMFFIQQSNSPIFTFLIRGGTIHVLDELKENLESAVHIAIQTLKDGKVLPGAGALESEMSDQIQTYSSSIATKEQMVVSEYGKIFDNLLGFIVLNTGEDPLTIIPNLKNNHAKGKKYDGFDVNSNTIIDVVRNGIFDGYFCKKHAIQIATEMARQIIRIDKLLMVYDRKLYETLEQRGKRDKEDKRNEQMRQYFKKHEKDLTP